MTYGLGTENENLPGFIVFTDHRGGPINGAAQLGQRLHAGGVSGHAVPRHGPPIVDLKPPAERAPEQQRKWLKFLRRS